MGRAEKEITQESTRKRAQKVQSGHCSSPRDGPEPDITQTPVHERTGSISGAAVTADKDAHTVLTQERRRRPPRVLRRPFSQRSKTGNTIWVGG